MSISHIAVSGYGTRVILIVIGALGTIPKGLVTGMEGLEIREQMETIQTISLLRLVRIPGRVLET